MIGLTNVDMEEAEQIQKSLQYGEKKLVRNSRPDHRTGKAGAGSEHHH
jgi:hypothetical protein